MAPEQARGAVVDRRADIWAFGVVLYEMLTGKQVFAGATVSDTLAAVLRHEPDFGRIPRKVRQLLIKCLEKDPKRRLRDIGDAWALLEESPAEGSRSRSNLMPAVAVAAMLVASVGWWRATHPAAQPLQPLVQTDVDLGSELSLSPLGDGGSSVIISADGTRLGYVASRENIMRLFTRRLDQPKATELLGTEGAEGPFFSPDGQWIGFAAANKLSKISVEGGALVSLGAAPHFAGASWGEDGNIIVSPGLGPLERIPSGGGAPTPVTELANGELAHLWPQVLPGSRAILFTVWRAQGWSVDKASIEAVSLGDHRRKTLVLGGFSGRYLPSGHLVYANRGTLFAIQFDLDRLQTRGNAVPVLDGIAHVKPYGGDTQFDLSRSGTLVYRRDSGGGGPEMATVQWLDGKGKKQPLLAQPGIYSTPRLSPDGKLLALVVNNGGSWDIRVYDPQRDVMTRLTSCEGPCSLIWSPDGRHIVFGAANGIYSTRADGAGQPQRLTQSQDFQFPWSFSPDGKLLAANTIDPLAGWTVPIEDKGGQLRALTPGPSVQTQWGREEGAWPTFSPDGRWLAYVSSDFEVYVRAFPPLPSAPGGKWQVSNSGGFAPRWSLRGHDLLYQSGDQIMAASYSVKGDTFVPDKPRVWIAKLGIADRQWSGQWDLAPDGNRVLVLTSVEPAAPKQDHEIVFVQNFSDELRRKVPGGK